MPEAEAGHERGAQRGAAGGAARRNFGDYDQPVLFFGLAVDCHGCRADHGRTRRRHSRRRHRIHDHGSHGRQQGFAESLADGPQSGRLPQHGPDGGKCCPQVRHHARASGRVFAREPQKGSCRNCRRKIQGRNRARGSENDCRLRMAQTVTPRKPKQPQPYSKPTKARAPTRAWKLWRSSSPRSTRAARPPPETARR